MITIIDKQKYEIIVLDRCEVGVPDGSGGIESCNEPAVAIIYFVGEESISVCQEHLNTIQNELEESDYYVESEE
jgi:hypothetical protein